MAPSKGKEKGNYVEDILKVSFDDITSAQLYDFLYRIEQPDDCIFIKRIDARKVKKQEGYINANIEIMTYKNRDS